MARIASHVARFRADQRGSNVVEFALVVPILLAFLFGIFEFGQAAWTQGILDFAVEQAARCASVNTTACGSSSLTASFAAGLTKPLNLPASVFNASTPGCGNLVTASYQLNFIGNMPLFGASLFPTSITLTSRSCYPV
ncbi:MAG TPA: TadE family protein [Stellaceae bacterium]|nr:TadE family protein [Stellaceae bacterium]